MDLAQKPFLRHPLFWTLLLLTSAGAGIVSYLYFSTAIPLVDLHISMSRAEAFSKAALIAEKYHLGPQQFKKAAYFNTDSETQSFIELERGDLKRGRHSLQTPITSLIPGLSAILKRETPTKYLLNLPLTVRHMVLLKPLQNLLPGPRLLSRCTHKSRAIFDQ